MKAHQDQFEVKIMCRVLGVSSSGYYAWLHRQEQPAGPREQANAHLSDAIWTVFRRSRGTYGSPRIHAEVVQSGMPCSRKRVARLMKLHGVQARRRRLYNVQDNNQFQAQLPGGPEPAGSTLHCRTPESKMANGHHVRVESLSNQIRLALSGSSARRLFSQGGWLGNG
jgi:transposase InsO family protein